MNKKITSALISVFYKDGLELLVKTLNSLGVTIYSTGGTQSFIEKLGVPVIPVEDITTYPSILGGRVKTLHPSIFGGILGRRELQQDVAEMQQYAIPVIDLVIVDLYPFQETLSYTTSTEFMGTQQQAEAMVIEKIDVGGPSMLRAAAKNHSSVVVISDKKDYSVLVDILTSQQGETTLEQRRQLAKKAFDVCTSYDTAISNYFNASQISTPFNQPSHIMRYGENPHQQAVFYGDYDSLFIKFHGKELSYNNLVDVDAAFEIMAEFAENDEAVFAIIKHTNVCGIAQRSTVKNSWDAALAGDPESAFGGILACNKIIDVETAKAIQEIFFEVLVAPAFEPEALDILQTKKNRILLQTVNGFTARPSQQRSILNGLLVQQADEGNVTEWREVGAMESTPEQKEDLLFANLVCKHLKSNAIALVKNKQLIGKGCGQTSRVDSLRQSIDKAKQFDFDLNGAVLASDAFFPFDDCVKLAHAVGVVAYIQPGGSIRDQDSIKYCKENNLVMVLTGMRHFRH